MIHCMHRPLHVYMRKTYKRCAALATVRAVHSRGSSARSRPHQIRDLCHGVRPAEVAQLAVQGLPVVTAAVAAGRPQEQRCP